MDPRISSNQSHQKQQAGGPQETTFRGKPIQKGLTPPDRGIIGTIWHVLVGAPASFIRQKLSSKPYSSLTFSHVFPEGQLNKGKFGQTMQQLGKAQKTGEGYSKQSVGVSTYLRDQFVSSGDEGFERLAQFREQVESYKETLEADIEAATARLGGHDQDMARSNLANYSARLAGANTVLESHECIVADELFAGMKDEDIFANIPLQNLINQMPEDSEARYDLQDYLDKFEADERPTISANLKTLESILGKNTDRNNHSFTGAQLLRAMPDAKVAEIMYHRFGGSPSAQTLLAALPKDRRASVEVLYIEIELTDPYGYRNGIDMAAQINSKDTMDTIVNRPKDTLIGNLSERVIRLQYEQRVDQSQRQVQELQSNVSKLEGKKASIGKLWADRLMRSMNGSRIKGELGSKKTAATRELESLRGEDGEVAKAEATLKEKLNNVRTCESALQEAKDDLALKKNDTDKQERVRMSEEALATAKTEAEQAKVNHSALQSTALGLEADIAEYDRQLENFDLETAALEGQLREKLGIGETDDLSAAYKAFSADMAQEIKEAKEELAVAKEDLEEARIELDTDIEEIRSGAATPYSKLDDDVILRAYEVEKADDQLSEIRSRLISGESPQDIADKDKLWKDYEETDISEKLGAIREQMRVGNTEGLLANEALWNTFKAEAESNAELLSAYKSLVQTVSQLICNFIPDDEINNFFNNIANDLPIIEEHQDGIEHLLGDMTELFESDKRLQEDGVKMQKAADAANIAKQGVVLDGKPLTPANMPQHMDAMGLKTIQAGNALRNGKVAKTDPKVDKAIHEAAAGNASKLANINSIIIHDLATIGALIFRSNEVNDQAAHLGGPASQSLTEASHSHHNRLVGLESLHASVQDEAARLIMGNNSVTVKSIQAIEDPYQFVDILAHNESFKSNPGPYIRLIADIKGKEFAKEVLGAIGDRQITGMKLSAAYEALASIPEDLPEAPEINGIDGHQVSLRSFKENPYRMTDKNFSREMYDLGRGKETGQGVATRLLRFNGRSADKLTAQDVQGLYGDFEEKVINHRAALQEHLDELIDLRDESLETDKADPKLLREINRIEKEIKGIDKLLDGIYFLETGSMRRPSNSKIDIGAFNLNLGNWHPLTNHKFPYELRRIVRKETSPTEIQSILGKQMDGDQAAVLASKLAAYDHELELMILKVEELQLTQVKQGNPDPRIATALEGLKQERQGLSIMRQAVNNLLPKDVDEFEIDMIEATVDQVDIDDDSHNDRGRVDSNPRVIPLAAGFNPSQEPVLDLGGESIVLQFSEDSAVHMNGDNILTRLQNLYMNDVIALNPRNIAHIGKHLIINGDPKGTVDKLKVYQAQIRAHIAHTEETGGTVDLKFHAAVHALGILIPIIEKKHGLMEFTNQSFEEMNAIDASTLTDLTPAEAMVLSTDFNILGTTIVDDIDDEDYEDLDIPDYNLEPGVITIDYEVIDSDNFWEELGDLDDPTTVQLDLGASKTGATADSVIQELARIRQETNDYLLTLEAGDDDEEIEATQLGLEKLDLLMEGIWADIERSREDLPTKEKVSRYVSTIKT